MEGRAWESVMVDIPHFMIYGKQRLVGRRQGQDGSVTPRPSAIDSLTS